MSSSNDMFSDHAAVRAWRRVCPNAGTPVAVEVLKESKGSAAYRLAGAGIVAKRAEMETALVERAIYQEILPKLPLTSLRLHGFLNEDERGLCWLFLEDSGGAECSFESAVQRAQASRWIARLHLSAAHLPAAAALPARDTRYYLEEVHRARLLITGNFGNPVLTSADRAVLEDVLRCYDRLQSRWSAIADRCAGFPSTLVHCDFHAKNVHRRGDRVLYVLDWEYAGWGLPAADLPELDLASYREIAGGFWSDLEWLFHLGRVFQCVSAVSWASTHLAYESAGKGVGRLRWYPEELEAGLTALGLQ